MSGRRPRGQPVPVQQRDFRIRARTTAVAAARPRPFKGRVWSEEVVAMIEKAASAGVRGAQAPDEKYVTERDFDNPKFVEGQ